MESGCLDEDVCIKERVKNDVKVYLPSGGKKKPAAGHIFPHARISCTNGGLAISCRLLMRRIRRIIGGYCHVVTMQQAD